MPSVAARIAAYEKNLKHDGTHDGIVTTNSGSQKPTTCRLGENKKPIPPVHVARPSDETHDGIAITSSGSQKPTCRFGEKKTHIPPVHVARPCDEHSTKTTSTSASSSSLSLETKIDNPCASKDFEVQLHAGLATEEAEAPPVAVDAKAPTNASQGYNGSCEELLGTHVSFSEGGECSASAASSNLSACSQSHDRAGNEVEDDDDHELGEAALRAAIAAATGRSKETATGGLFFKSAAADSIGADEPMVIGHTAGEKQKEVEEMFQSIEYHLDSITKSYTRDHTQDCHNEQSSNSNNIQYKASSDAGFLDEIGRIFLFTDVIDRKPAYESEVITIPFSRSGSILSASDLLAPLWKLPQAVGTSLYNSGVEAYQEVEKTCKEVERVVLFTDVPDALEPEKEQFAPQEQELTFCGNGEIASLVEVSAETIVTASVVAAQPQPTPQLSDVLQTLEHKIMSTDMPDQPSRSRSNSQNKAADSVDPAPPILFSLSQALQTLEQKVLFTDLPDQPSNKAADSVDPALPILLSLSQALQTLEQKIMSTDMPDQPSNKVADSVDPALPILLSLSQALQTLEQKLLFTDLPDQPSHGHNRSSVGESAAPAPPKPPSHAVHIPEISTATVTTEAMTCVSIYNCSSPKSSTVTPHGELARVLQNFEQKLLYTDLLGQANTSQCHDDNSHRHPAASMATLTSVHSNGNGECKPEKWDSDPDDRVLNRPPTALTNSGSRSSQAIQISEKKDSPRDMQRRLQELMQETLEGEELRKSSLVVEHCSVADVTALTNSQAMTDNAVIGALLPSSVKIDQAGPASRSYVVALVLSEKLGPVSEVVQANGSTIDCFDAVSNEFHKEATAACFVPDHDMASIEAHLAGADQGTRQAAHHVCQYLKTEIGVECPSDETSDAAVLLLTNAKENERCSKLSSVRSAKLWDEIVDAHVAGSKSEEHSTATKGASWTSRDEHVLERIMNSMKSETLTASHSRDEVHGAEIHGPCSIVEVHGAAGDGSTWGETSFITANENYGEDFDTDFSHIGRHESLGEAGCDGVEWNRSRSASDGESVIAPIVPQRASDTGAYDALLAQIDQLESSIDNDLERAHAALRSPSRRHAQKGSGL
jgi:hypothetical protein